MEQNFYVLLAMTYQSLGNTAPQIFTYSTLADAQAQWYQITQAQELWNEEVNWLQILTIPTTVYQATDGSPSGIVTPPADPGTGD
jgi:hypothetical protein